MESDKHDFKRGQIWVETVIYTLIGLSLIGLVLAIVTPQINEYKDRRIIEQTLDSLNAVDEIVGKILSAPGNIRIAEFQMKRGELNIDPTNDAIIYVMDDSRALYSEPGTQINVGRVKVLSEENIEGRRNTITLTLDYNGKLDLSFDGDQQTLISYSSTSLPFRFSFENKGLVVGKANIDIREVS